MRMYYHSFDRSRQRFVVGLATSPDGFKWTKKGPIFEVGGWWAGGRAGRRAGGQKGGRAGRQADMWSTCSSASLGCAFTNQGLPSLALLPSTLFPLSTCLQGGSSPDDFDARGAAGRCVVRDIDSRQFFMFYEAVAADGARSIGVAVSADGLTGWQRCPTPVLSGSGAAGAWDAGAVGCPWAVSMAGGAWRLYYSGRQQAGSGGWGGIGMARSHDSAAKFQGAPTRFQRHGPTSS
jgi:hypothetical protein